MRELRDDWGGYAALTDASKKKITEDLLQAGEKLANEIDAGRSSKPEEDLLKLAEMIKKVKSSTANQTKIPYLIQRRIDKLGDLHGKILSKMGEGTSARSEVIEASDLESYLAALEHAPNHLINPSLEKFVEAVLGITNAMVSHPVLGKIIGSDAITPIPGTYLALALS